MAIPASVPARSARPQAPAPRSQSGRGRLEEVVFGTGGGAVAAEVSRDFIFAQAAAADGGYGMRSEKERAGGPSATAATRVPGGRDKLPPAEVQFRRESPWREPGTPASSSGCGGGASKPREEKRTALSKVNWTGAGVPQSLA